MTDSPTEVPYLSFVSPVYGSPQSLPGLHDRIAAVCAELGVTFELILVDDRCPMDSWSVIQDLAAAHPTVRGVRLSRNFGQHPAIQAGLALVRGQWVVVIDCDLQDRPEEVPRLLAKAKEGFDIVRARKVARKDVWHRRLASQAFYRTLSYLTDSKQTSEIGNFGLYRRAVIDSIMSWREDGKFFPIIINWAGYAQAEVEVEHSERAFGKSSYTTMKLIRLAMDVILSFSDKPLRICIVMGLGISSATFLAALFTLTRVIFFGTVVAGWASIAFSVWFLSGVIITVLGVSGLYIGRVLNEAKGRPVFIVDRIAEHGSDPK